MYFYDLEDGEEVFEYLMRTVLGGE